jgi:hypothetical protein
MKLTCEHTRNRDGYPVEAAIPALELRPCAGRLQGWIAMPGARLRQQHVWSYAMKTTNEVIFRAPDLAGVRAYYSGKLGLPVVLDTDSMIGFDSGALNFYFERGEPHGPVFEFSVEDVARAKGELISAGCELVEENPAVPRVYLRDPFGLVFNITEG